MQKSNAPTKLTVVFASGSGAGPVNTVPLTTNPTTGGVSYQTGFTSVNMEPIASGGVPPFGADFNGLVQAQTKAQIWQQSGYLYSFDSAFASNANIGGYPAGSVLLMGGGKGVWINQADNNITSPDTTGSSGWLGLPAAGTATIATTGGTTTPDPSVLGVTTLLITGTLASNATIVLPLTAGARWIVSNNTTGSFTLTVQGASGSGVSITSGSPLAIFTDGTNYYGVSANLTGAYLPIGGTAVAATKLATARTIAMTGDVSWTSPAFDGTSNITAAGTIAAGAVTLAKMAAFQANSLMGNPTGSAGIPSAITLQNGLVFSGTNLGLGAITPSSISASGNITSTGTINSSSGYTFQSDLNALVYLVSAGVVGVRSSGGYFSFDGSGNFNALNGAVSAVDGLQLSGTGSSNTDLTHGIRLYLTQIGFGITSSRLNYVVPSGNQHVFLVNGTDTMTIGAGAVSVTGTLSSTGTASFNTSDRRLKTAIHPITARPVHRLIQGDGPLCTYDRIDMDAHGVGPMAQDVLDFDPIYTGREIAPRQVGDNAPERYLLVDKAGLAYEAAIYAGQTLDVMAETLAEMQHRLEALEEAK